ncbi:hypothetical protein L195_g056118 [Trifolium pratense]|uniref:Uncharacterized protein n=1 Tax=Trifolium pratense TaxID=57577 RepID=A0A2K3KPW7_TRIPR|nr:hypothetical protein L195_g056118 [Trifolium pratense]
MNSDEQSKELQLIVSLSDEHNDEMKAMDQKGTATMKEQTAMVLESDEETML